MVDPLDPRNDPQINPVNTDPRLSDHPSDVPPPARGGSSYLLGAVILVAIIILGYFFYQSRTGTETAAPVSPATQGEPATPAPAQPANPPAQN